MYQPKIKWFVILWFLWLQKKGSTANFSLSSYVAIVESGIWDPKIRDPGCIKIRILDPESATLLNIHRFFIQKTSIFSYLWFSFSVPHWEAKFLTGSSSGTTHTSFIGNAHLRSMMKRIGRIWQIIGYQYPLVPDRWSSQKTETHEYTILKGGTWSTFFFSIVSNFSFRRIPFLLSSLFNEEEKSFSHVIWYFLRVPVHNINCL